MGECEREAIVHMLGSVASRVHRMVPAVGVSVRAIAHMGTAPTFDYRRMKRRSEWPPPPDPEGSEEITWGRTGHGIDPALNWALNEYKVTPKDLAYRNLHLQGLRMLTDSARDEQKRVVIPAGAEDAEFYVTGLEGSSNGVEPATAALAARDVRAYLSDLDALFVHDGAVGAGQSEIRSRAITDSPAIALGLRHMMQRIRLGHPYDLVEKVVPDLEEALSLNFDSEEERNAHRAEYENTIAELKEANKRIAHFATLIAGTLPSKKLGFSEKASVSIFNPEEKLLVIAGSPSIGTIVNSIADASNHFLAPTTDALPLGRSHVLTDAKGEGSVLFGHPQAIICPELFSAHNNAWSASGLHRSFAGVMVQNPSKSHSFSEGDLLEQGAKSSTLTTPHEARTNHIDHPKSAVFVVQDSSLPALSTATVAQGVRLFEELSGSTVPGVSGLGERFGTLAEGNGTKIYVVNGTKAANSVSKAIVAATNREKAPKMK